MRHYLKNLEDTVRKHWTQNALCDYNGDTFSYANLATNVEQFRIFFSTAGIGKGDKIALCGRNCAQVGDDLLGNQCQWLCGRAAPG